MRSLCRPILTLPCIPSAAGLDSLGLNDLEMEIDRHFGAACRDEFTMPANDACIIYIAPCVQGMTPAQHQAVLSSMLSPAASLGASQLSAGAGGSSGDLRQQWAGAGGGAGAGATSDAGGPSQPHVPHHAVGSALSLIHLCRFVAQKFGGAKTRW